MKTFIAAILWMASGVLVFGQGTAVRSKDGIATNLTARSTVTNLPAAITDTSGFINIFVPPTNSVAGQPLFQQWWTLVSQGTNRQYVFNRGYNVGPTGILNTNWHGWQETVEMNWDPQLASEPSNERQIEQYWTFYPRSNGTPYRVFGNTLRGGNGESRFNSYIFSVADPFSNDPAFRITTSSNSHQVTVSIDGQLIISTNESTSAITVRGGDIVWHVPNGVTASSVTSKVDWDNGLGNRPHFLMESAGTLKSFLTLGFTNLQFGAFGIRTPPGTSIATPKVWTDAIEATNSSGITISAGGDSLTLGSDAASYNGSSGFVGVGSGLTALNAGNIASGTLALARGGTGSSLSDPGADRLVGWDNTSNDIRFWTLGSGLSYDQATDTISSSGGSGDTNAISYPPDMTKAVGTRVTSAGVPVLEAFHTNGTAWLVLTNSGNDLSEWHIQNDSGYKVISSGPGSTFIRSAQEIALVAESTKTVLYASTNERYLRDTNNNTVIDFADGTTGVNITTLNPTTVNTTAINLGENSGAIALDAALSADGKSSGITRAGTAGATLAFGDLVVLDVTDSRWELADANSASGADGDARGMIGVCVLAAAADGDPTVVLLQGAVRADAVFPSFTVNAPIYVSETAGDITATSPTTSGNVVRILGAATTADEIYFDPDRVWTVYVP